MDRDSCTQPYGLNLIDLRRGAHTAKLSARNLIQPKEVEADSQVPSSKHTKLCPPLVPTHQCIEANLVP